MDFELNLNTIPPAPPTEEPKVEEQNNGAEEPIIETASAPTEQPKVEEPPKADRFFEELNKRFGSQFKGDDEFKALLDLPKKVMDYEAKLREHESLAKTIEDYKKKNDELEGNQDPLKYFSSPESYVAEQLRIKYPKNNPYVLQEIAMTNVDNMNDLDVLVKEKMMSTPGLKESNVRAIILKKYGIDASTPSEEWDELIRDEMKIDAATAREKINTVKSAIELPRIMTREQRQQAEAQAKAEREKLLTPMKETFTKFDKFSHKGIPGFEADVTGEYKSKLQDIFQGYFGDSGLQPTPENLEAALEFRDALFVYEHLPKLREIWLKEGKTESQKKIDEELHNDTPPNTATRTDQQDVKTTRGIVDFVRDQIGR